MLCSSSSDYTVAEQAPAFFFAATQFCSRLAAQKCCDSVSAYLAACSVAVECDSCVDACSVAVHGIQFSMSSLKSAIASRTPTSREELATIVEFMSWSVAFPAQLRPRVASVTPFVVASHACAICWIVTTSAARCKIMLT